MLTCDVCGKELKNMAGLKMHMRLKHGEEMAPVSSRPPLSEQGEPSEKGAPSKIMFHSPMSSELRIVVKRTDQVRVVTPAGIIHERVPGKTVEFRQGLYYTDDPEIIDFLENKYKDERFPVYSDRKLQGIVNAGKN